MASEETPTGDASAGIGTLFGHAIRNWAIVVGVSGAVVYGATALAYETFYGILGFTPKDVGIGQTEIITRSAIALALIGSILVALFVGLYAVVSFFLVVGHFIARENISEGLKQTRLGRILLALALTLFIGPTLPSTALLWYGAFMAGLSALLMLTIWRDARRIGRQDPSLSTYEILHRISKRRALFLVGMLGAFYVYGTFTAIARAEELARLVAEAYPEPAESQSTFYNFQADPACLIRTDSGGTHAFFRDYLGQSDGQMGPIRHQDWKWGAAIARGVGHRDPVTEYRYKQLVTDDE